MCGRGKPVQTTGLPRRKKYKNLLSNTFQKENPGDFEGTHLRLLTQLGGGGGGVVWEELGVWGKGNLEQKQTGSEDLALLGEGGGGS